MARAAGGHEQHARFRACAERHGLRLHRTHVLAPTKTGTFASTWIFDCGCGQRWLLRVTQGEAVSVDGAVLDQLRRDREGQATAPPGFPGLPEPAPALSGREPAGRPPRASAAAPAAGSPSPAG
jgi:hypothetical protein